jgi:ankyrin repeat protein
MSQQEKSFIEACINKELRRIQATIKYGVNIHIEDNWAIEIAAQNGFIDVTKLLLENGVSHEIAAVKKLLSYCCHFQYHKFIETLINESDAYKNDSSAFSWTAITGNIAIGELLLHYLNEDKLDGAIIRAAEHGKIEFLDFLIGNSIEEIDSSSERAVYWAAGKGRWDAVKYLLNHSIGTLNNLGKYKDYYEKNHT